jgi:hypothetical protein
VTISVQATAEDLARLLAVANRVANCYSNFMAANPPARDWLKVIENRLREVEAERGVVATSMALLESRAQLLNEEYVHLRAILEIPRPNELIKLGSRGSAMSSIDEHLLEGDTARGDHTLMTSDVRGDSDVGIQNLSPTWRDAVRDILMERKEPLHYRAIHQQLRRIGISFGGQNPAASFLAVLNRDEEFMRVGRGIYGLKGMTLGPSAKEGLPVVRRRSRAKVRKRT